MACYRGLRTVTAALAVFLTEVLSNDTSARVVTALARVITRHVVVHVTRCVLTAHRHFPAVHRPYASLHHSHSIVTSQTHGTFLQCTDHSHRTHSWRTGTFLQCTDHSHSIVTAQTHGAPALSCSAQTTVTA